jgi:hypothetical protein
LGKKLYNTDMANGYWNDKNLYVLDNYKWGIRELLAEGCRRELRTVCCGAIENIIDKASPPQEPVSKIDNGGIGKGDALEQADLIMTQATKRGRGRPRKQPGEEVSKSTLYRRKAEQGKLF